MSTDLNTKIGLVQSARDDIKQALYNKTGTTQSDDIRTYAYQIANIQTGIDTSDATANANDLIEGSTAYVRGSKISGSINKIYSSSDYSKTNTGLTFISTSTYEDTYDFADGYLILGETYTTQSSTVPSYKVPALKVYNSSGALLASSSKIPGGESPNPNANYNRNCRIFIINNDSQKLWFVTIVSFTRQYRYSQDEYYNTCHLALCNFDKTNNQINVVATSSPSAFQNGYPYWRISSFYRKNYNTFIVSDAHSKGYTFTVDYLQGTITSQYSASMNDLTYQGDVYYNLVPYVGATSSGIYVGDSSTGIAMSSQPQGITDNLNKIFMNGNLYTLNSNSVGSLLVSNILDSSTELLKNLGGNIFASSLGKIYTFDDTTNTLTLQEQIPNVDGYMIAASSMIYKVNNSVYVVYVSDTDKELIGLNRNNVKYYVRNYVSPTVVETNTGTITDTDVLATKIGFSNGAKITGTMPNNGAINITPSTSQQTIPAGYTSGGTVSAVTSSIDQNITAGNIKKDVTILGVTGSYEGSGGGDSPVYLYETTAAMNADTSKSQDTIGVIYSNIAGDFGTFESGIYTPTASFNKLYLPTKTNQTYKDLSKDGQYGYFDTSISGMAFESDSGNISITFDMMGDPYDPYSVGLTLYMTINDRVNNISWSAGWYAMSSISESDAYSNTTTSLFTVDRATGLITFNEQIKIKSINYNTVTSISTNEYNARAWMWTFGAVIANFGGLYIYDAGEQQWNPAENQLSLKSNSQLLRNISAYGNGNVFTGDGTIVNEISKDDIYNLIYNLVKDGSYYYGKNEQYPNVVIDSNWTNQNQIKHYEKDLNGTVIIGTRETVVKPANCYYDICAIFGYPYYRLASEKNPSTGSAITNSYILYDTRDGSVKKTVTYNGTPSPIGTYNGKTYFGGFWTSGSGSSYALNSAVWSIDLENGFTTSTAWTGTHSNSSNGYNYFAVPNKGWVMTFLDASSGTNTAKIYVYDITIGAIKSRTDTSSYTGSYGWSECRAWFTQDDAYLLVCTGSSNPTRIYSCNWGQSSISLIRSKSSEYLTIGYSNDVRVAYKINDALLDLNRKGQNASIPISEASDPGYYVDIQYNGESVVDTTSSDSRNWFAWIYDSSGNVIGLYYMLNNTVYDYSTLTVTSEPKYTSTQYILNFTATLDQYKLNSVNSQMHDNMNAYGWYIKYDSFYSVDNTTKPNFYPNYTEFNKYKAVTKIGTDTISVVNTNATKYSTNDNYLIFRMQNVVPDYTDPASI